MKLKKNKSAFLLSLLTFALGCGTTQISNASLNTFSVESKENVKYINDNNSLHTADLYIPQNKNNYPVVVFVHGGNWNSQDKNYFSLFTGLYGNFGRAMAKRGIGTLVINYRKNPEVKIDGMIDDIVASVKWTAENISNYKGNPDNIFLAGHSAGGHLASLTGVNLQLTQENGLNKRLRGIVALSPIFDIKNMRDISRPDYNESVTYPVFGRSDQELEKYSPITYFNKTTLPIFIAVGQKDYVSVFNQSYKAIESLNKLDNKSSLLEIPNLDHAGVILSVDKDVDKISEPAAKFIFDNSK